MEEMKLVAQYAPYLIPFLGAILLIIFTKKYLFAGMISAEMHREQLEREKELVRVQEEVSIRLTEIVEKLEKLAYELSRRPYAWDGIERRGPPDGRK
jgi:hypothetical protein